MQLSPPDLDDFSEVLSTSGIAEALRVLNGGVPHRYTAVYEIRGSVLVNLFLHDKAGEVRPEFLAEVPLNHSFCQFVLREGCFLTQDSAQDRRLDGHPYQGVMVTYHGVPLMGDTGELIGTLCHFDVEARGLSDLEFKRLQKAARLLPSYVKRSAGQP